MAQGALLGENIALTRQVSELTGELEGLTREIRDRIAEGST